MGTLDIILAQQSDLKKLLTGKSNNIRILKIDDTYVHVIAIESMPELIQLSFNGTLIKHINLRKNT